MLSQAQVDEFKRKGFLNGGKQISDEDLAVLKSELDEVLAKGPDGFEGSERKPVLYRNLSGNDDSPVWQILNMWEACPSFERLVYHPFIVGAISQLTNMPDLMVWHDQLQYKPKGQGGTTWWHQDAPLWPTIKPMTPVSAWIPLEDADAENGCMWMVPGSHKWGNTIKDLGRASAEGLGFHELSKLDFVPPADAEIQEIKPECWPVMKGEISFHHSLTWHGSPDNKSTRPRPAIAIHYMTGQAVYCANSGHPMEQFIDLPDGAPMAEAGDHFPRVCRDGKPVPAPASAQPR